MEKVYRTIKSSKSVGAVSRKKVATAVRALSIGKLGRNRDAGGHAPSKTAKEPMSANSRWKKA